MEILVAEDDAEIASFYKITLEEKRHRVILTENGEQCLEVYNDKWHNIRYLLTHASTTSVQPFDVVILDHKMPRINGLDVAKEILVVNPRQRIIFLSTYVDILEESTKQYLEKQDIELLQKSINPLTLIDTIEDRAIYSQLEKFGIDSEVLKFANFTHKQLVFLLDTLKKHDRKWSKRKFLRGNFSCIVYAL